MFASAIILALSIGDDMCLGYYINLINKVKNVLNFNIVDRLFLVWQDGFSVFAFPLFLLPLKM